MLCCACVSFQAAVVPFDWVSFVAMLLVHRFPELMKTEKRELWVGRSDASVLVLKDTREYSIPCRVPCTLCPVPCPKDTREYRGPCLLPCTLCPVPCAQGHA